MDTVVIASLIREFTILTIVLARLLFVFFIYKSIKKRHPDNLDCVMKAFVYIIISNVIGILFVLIFSQGLILLPNHPEIYYLPVVGFLISVLLMFCLVYLYAFSGQKQLFALTMKLLLLFSPYYLFLQILLDSLEYNA